MLDPPFTTVLGNEDTSIRFSYVKFGVSLLFESNNKLPNSFI